MLHNLLICRIIIAHSRTAKLSSRILKKCSVLCTTGASNAVPSSHPSLAVTRMKMASTVLTKLWTPAKQRGSLWQTPVKMAVEAVTRTSVTWTMGVVIWHGDTILIWDGWMHRSGGENSTVTCWPGGWILCGKTWPLRRWKQAFISLTVHCCLFPWIWWSVIMKRQGKVSLGNKQMTSDLRKGGKTRKWRGTFSAN